MHHITIITNSRRLRSVSAQVEVAAVLPLAGTVSDARPSRSAGLTVNSHMASAFDWRNWSRVKNNHNPRI